MTQELRTGKHSSFLTHPELRARLAGVLAETRERTLALAAAVPEEERCRRLHALYSPFDWHLGHVGMTEGLWVLQCAAGLTPPQPRLDFIFANIPENPKDHRSALPSRTEILNYLQQIRRQTLEFLQTADFDSTEPLLKDGYCFAFALAHEWQHQETMVEMLSLVREALKIEAPGALRIQNSHSGGRPAPGLQHSRSDEQHGQVKVPEGDFRMGIDLYHAYDNEKPAHLAWTGAYSIDRMPVTVEEYARFIGDGGYERAHLWQPAGWEWLTASGVREPLYWSHGPFGARQPDSREPVCGVSWYEADAYARWAGKRLPSEEEWEKAAAWDPVTGETRVFPWGSEEPTPEKADFGLSAWAPTPVGLFPEGRSAAGLLDMAGGVWEWTSSVFAPYEGFVAYPYDGYSKDHFDGTLRVLKGGSWATQGPLLRCSFRNFYTPDFRHGFLGFRCVQAEE